MRTGWILKGVSQEVGESVADHSWSVAMMADTLAAKYAPQLDRNKLMRMAMVHELGEIDAGDVTPACSVSKEEKSRFEELDVRRVLEGMPNADEYLALWKEFEAKESPEAQWVNQIDKLEMAMQYWAYNKRELLETREFYESTRKVLSDENLKKIFEDMVATTD